jgi:energy-coupling factor transporter ATP-binding protein EcfA2
LLLLTSLGINRPADTEDLTIQDYGRYNLLMESTQAGQQARISHPSGVSGSRDSRNPSLVSFVGQTGAGKSTLIKLLIDLNVKEGENYPTPVVGATGSEVPTSENVHLYMDPLTVHSSFPMLYADCEGLQGGVREPMGAKARKHRWAQGHTETTGSETNYLKAARVVAEKELKWANTPATRTRQYIVTNLYPRLLYTFSDVVVFVLRNPR